MTSHQHELDILLGLLGIPGYILSTFFPASIKNYAARRPKLFRAICVLAALATFGTSFLERLKDKTLSFLVSRFMFSTRIDTDDPLHSYVLCWLHDHHKILPEQEVYARSKEDFRRNSAYKWDDLSEGRTDLWQLMSRNDGNTPDDPVIYNSTGLQIFLHKWKPYFVDRGSKELALYCFGVSNKALLGIVSEACKTYQAEEKTRKISVYRAEASSQSWLVAKKSKRSLESIVLDADQKSDLLKDVTFYLADTTEEWYAARGIPYRRGYLFHGQPGTGKTSLSMAIAGHFGLDIYVISLRDPYLNDEILHTFLTYLSKNVLILLEDIDSAGLTREAFEESIVTYKKTNKRRKGRAAPESRVTLSGLLNAIDGANSPEGHVLVMTTNAPEALDNALIRPGRIDYKIEFKAISPPQAHAMFMRMYQDDIDKTMNLRDLAIEFSNSIMDDTFTPAELQGYLIRYRHEPSEALYKLGEWQLAVLEERRKLAEARLSQNQELLAECENREKKETDLENNIHPPEHDSNGESESVYHDAE